jgi:hypothetical protein
MKEEIWYKNPYILFKNFKDFFPRKNMNEIQKLNAITRFAIYYAVLIIVLKLDTKWLAVSLCLLILTVFFSYSENFEKDDNKCTMPTKENPFMNFTTGDLINNPNKPGACQNVREEQIKMYRSNNIFLDLTDLWGTNISDRNFHTMPSTTIVNNQQDFGKFLYGDFGKCKSEGKDCLKHRDNKYHRGRVQYI